MRIANLGPKKRPIPVPSFLATAIAAALLCVQPTAQAQDTRDVHEPSLPKSCAVVTAEAATTGRDDAARIQKAIDQCTQGGAVHLAPGSDNKTNTSFTAGVLNDGMYLSLIHI